MLLKKNINGIKAAIINGFPFLVVVYVYSISSMVYLNVYGVTEYASIYTINLFISFALSCIACRDFDLKIIRFDFQFRMTFVYLVLLLISWLTIISASIINNDIWGPKEAVSGFILNFLPATQYELDYSGPVEIVVESFFYGVLSPLIYLFASLSFSFKKVKNISIASWLLCILLLTINGFLFGAMGLLVQLTTDLYLYSPFFAINYITLIVLSYAAGKNSFIEVPNC